MSWRIGDVLGARIDRRPYRLRGTILVLYAVGSLALPVLQSASSVTFASRQSNGSASAQSELKGDPATGRILFEQRCGLCHGINGGGGRGPNLRRHVLQHGSTLAEIASVIKNGIPPDMPEGWYFSDQDLANLASYVYSLGQTPQAELPGDPERGRAVFEQSGCLSCHILGGRGNGYGSDLTNVGAVRGQDRLRQTLIDPKTSATPDFLLVEAVMASGKTVQGIRRNEDTLTIQIQDSSGNFHSLAKSRLRSLKRLRGETPMPSFGGILSQRQVDDLVSFLAVQRGGR